MERDARAGVAAHQEQGPAAGRARGVRAHRPNRVGGVLKRRREAVLRREAVVDGGDNRGDGGREGRAGVVKWLERCAKEDIPAAVEVQHQRQPAAAAAVVDVDAWAGRHEEADGGVVGVVERPSLEMRRRANESDEKFLHSNLTPLLQNATEVLRDEEKPVVCAMNRKRKLLVLFFGTAFFFCAMDRIFSKKTWHTICR